MESRNPVFSKSKAFSNTGQAAASDAPVMSAQQLQDLFNSPTATRVQTGRMTMDDVVIKTGLMFAVLLPAAALNYVLNNSLLTFGGMIVGLVVGLVVSFKQSTNAALILSYAGLEGLFVGGISRLFENSYNGIIAQAVLATLSVFGVALFAYKSGRVRVTPKFQRTVMIAMGGYLVFILVNLGVSMFTDSSLRSGPLGLAVGAFAVVLAAAMLILDFDFADQGVKNGLPTRFAWLAAFGLVVTLVWLYIELLRLISILRGSD